MNDNYTECTSSEDENLFFEHVIQQDFDLLFIDALLRQISLGQENVA